MKTAIVKTATLTALVSSLTLLGMSAVAYADDAPAAAPAGPTLPSFPSIGGSLTANPKPFSFDAGPVGTVYVTGVASAISVGQTNLPANIEKSQVDVSNAQISLNKTEGLVQFAAQVGSYSLPDLGSTYVKSSKITDATYGTFSQGYIKLAPTGSFSLEIGKLPTLIGNEYTFSTENFNIQRGLLWNQENAVSRGVQANYAVGPVAVSAAWTDGFYSGKYNWATLSAAWTIDSADTLTFVGGGNTDRKTKVNTPVTNVYQNNSQIYNLIYTRTSGPWTIQPYLQYTDIPKLAGSVNGTGVDSKSTSTTGAALLASYKVNDNISLPVRLEYITQSGSKGDSSAPLLYGAGSAAWSLTITPTYQYKIFFVRGELSYVGLNSGTVGSEFGKNGDKTNQVAGLIETGVMF